MSDVFWIATFIVFPAAIIFAVVSILFKDRTYALRSSALYLMVVATILLGMDERIKASVALIVGGVAILTSTFLFKIHNVKISKALALIMFALSISLLIYYAYIQYSIALNIDYALKGNCTSLPEMRYGASRFDCILKVNITMQNQLAEPPRVYVCESSSYALVGLEPIRAKDNTYIYEYYVPPYSSENLRICIKYGSEWSDCKGCMYEQYIKK